MNQYHSQYNRTGALPRYCGSRDEETLPHTEKPPLEILQAALLPATSIALKGGRELEHSRFGEPLG
eukprot:1364583-Rhodomonas_salina.1